MTLVAPVRVQGGEGPAAPGVELGLPIVVLVALGCVLAVFLVSIKLRRTTDARRRQALWGLLARFMFSALMAGLFVLVLVIQG
jgi:hypothetical protein